MGTDIKRLIGDDGKLLSATVATVATSGSLTSGWYKISTKAAAASAFGDLPLGQYYYAPATVSLTAGDAAFAVTTADLADVKAWSFETTADEVETTVLKDVYKHYRKGKMDASGSGTFIFMKGTTDLNTGILAYFYDMAEISAAGVVTSYQERLDTPMLLIGYMDAEETDGQYFIAAVFEVEFMSAAYTGASSEAVEFESPFRLAGATDPMLLKVTLPIA